MPEIVDFMFFFITLHHINKALWATQCPESLTNRRYSHKNRIQYFYDRKKIVS